MQMYHIRLIVDPIRLLPLNDDLGNPFAVKRLTSDCLYTSRNNYLCIHIGSKTVLKCLPSNIGKALRQFKNRILVTTTGHADIPKSFAPVKYRTGRG